MCYMMDRKETDHIWYWSFNFNSWKNPYCLVTLRLSCCKLLLTWCWLKKSLCAASHQVQHIHVQYIISKNDNKPVIGLCISFTILFVTLEYVSFQFAVLCWQQPHILCVTIALECTKKPYWVNDLYHLGLYKYTINHALIRMCSHCYTIHNCFGGMFTKKTVCKWTLTEAFSCHCFLTI
jgi:hypothetical protein